MNARQMLLNKDVNKFNDHKITNITNTNKTIHTEMSYTSYKLSKEMRTK